MSFCHFVIYSFCLFGNFDLLSFLSFCLFVFLSFCLFVFLSFCLFVLTSCWSNVWKVSSLKCHALCWKWHSLTDSLTKVRYRAARAAKNVESIDDDNNNNNIPTYLFRQLDRKLKVKAKIGIPFTTGRIILPKALWTWNGNEKTQDYIIRNNWNITFPFHKTVFVEVGPLRSWRVLGRIESSASKYDTIWKRNWIKQTFILGHTFQVEKSMNMNTRKSQLS